MLIKVINTINTELKKLQPLVQVEVVYGNRAVPFAGPTPRVVWTFVSDTFTPTRHLGTNPHQVRSMESKVEAHIFHKSVDEVYFLVNDVIVAATRTVLQPSLLNVDGFLLDPGQNAQNGYGYKLSMVLDITIVEPPLKIAPITVVEPTITIEIPS